MPKPIRETRVLKLVFITIPCLKVWALRTLNSADFVYTKKGFKDVHFHIFVYKNLKFLNKLDLNFNPVPVTKFHGDSDKIGLNKLPSLFRFKQTTQPA